MNNPTSEAFAYIERQYRDVKGQIELQRYVVKQLQIIEADASEAEASLSRLLEDEAPKVRILDYLRRWPSRNLEETPDQRRGRNDKKGNIRNGVSTDAAGRADPSCPICAESDRHPSLPRNDATCH